MARGSDQAQAQIQDGRTASSNREVFVPLWATEAVEDHIAEHGRGRQDLIFGIPRRTIQEEHARVRERIGKPSYTIHDHRHTAAVARAGMPLHLLQKQLRHGKINPTMRCAEYHPDYSDVKAHFEAVADSLGLNSTHVSGHISQEEAREEVEEESSVEAKRERA